LLRIDLRLITLSLYHPIIWLDLPEYWVVAIPRRELIVHRQPTPEGYADVQTYSDTASVPPLAAFDSPVQVADLLPW